MIGTTKNSGAWFSRLRGRGAVVLLMFGAASLCVSCLGDDDDESYRVVRRDSGKNRANLAKAKAAQAEKDKEAAVFSYSPIGKRDPFRSYISGLVKDAGTKSGATKAPTEEYELNQYKLTGLLSGNSQPRALVEDPKGAGHVVKIGTPLGRNGGRVTRISNNTVEVVEEFRAPTGERIRVPITIELPRDEITLKARP